MLHQLIDALPEERLQNVERVLQYEGITPSSVGSGPGKIPDEIAARIREQLANRPIKTDDWDSLRTKMRQGIAGTTERLRVNGIEPAQTMRDGASTACHGADKDGALLVLTFRYFKGTRNLNSRSVCRSHNKVTQFGIARTSQVLMVSTCIARLSSRSLRPFDLIA